MNPSRKADVFIKIEEYKDILDIINIIQSKIKHARGVLNRVNELKNQEDSELEDWKISLDEVEKRIEFIDKVLLEPETL
ncbi:MAG: hypothetical protein V1740_02755 [Candidatus Woesearchaeota archaeon]